MGRVIVVVAVVVWMMPIVCEGGVSVGVRLGVCYLMVGVGVIRDCVMYGTGMIVWLV